jgi:hypothetical protein
LVDGAVDPTAIQNYLNSIQSALDVDLNQQADALSDGIVIIRNLFGFTGDASSMDLSLKYVQRSWVDEFVTDGASQADEDEEVDLLIAMPGKKESQF